MVKRLVLCFALCSLSMTIGCGFGNTTATDGGVGSNRSASPKIVFASDRNGQGVMQLYLMNLDGTQQAQLPLSSSFAGLVWDPVISPDGKKIVFSYQGSSTQDLYSVNIDGTGLTQLTTAADSYSPQFSADGERVVFIRRNSSGVPHVWTMARNGSDQVDLTSGSTLRYASASFAPDGQHIIATRNPNANGSGTLAGPRRSVSGGSGPTGTVIVSMNLDGSHETMLALESDENGVAQLAPNGTSLVFTVRVTQNEIVSETVSGHTRTVLTPADSNNFNPVISGGYIFFVSTRDGNSAVYRMNLDGTGVLRLTDPAQNSSLGKAVH